MRLGPARAQVELSDSWRLARQAVEYGSMSQRLISERGQATLEWGGLLVLIALVIGALITSGAFASVASGVECNVTKILGGSVSCANGQGRPAPPAPDQTDPWNSSNPVTQ